MNVFDDMNVLLKSTDQINDIMRNKNKFVVTRLSNQHVYNMKKNIHLKNNIPKQDTHQSLQEKSGKVKKTMSVQYLNSSNAGVNSSLSPLKTEPQVQYALKLGSPSNQFPRQQSIQQMLQYAGHDVNTKYQQVQVENLLQNSLKKRTFYNCNRGIGLFEPKFSSFNQRNEIHRIKLRTNDPLAILLHYTVNQSISEKSQNNQNQQSSNYQSQIHNADSQLKNIFSQKEQLKFLDEILRQSYIEGLNKAVFKNESILQDQQIEKTFLVENKLYEEQMNMKRIKTNSQIHLPKLKQFSHQNKLKQNNNINYYQQLQQDNNDSHFFEKEDESLFQKVKPKISPRHKQFQSQQIHNEEYEQ